MRNRLQAFSFRVLATTGALWALLTFTPIVNTWTQWLAAGYSDEPSPVLIVLAGDSANDTVLGYSSYLRCIYAFWFWQQKHPREIIVSGGPPEHPLSAVMADFMVSLGVPRPALRLETSSRNTQENLFEVAKLVPRDSQPITLLTSDYHMRRALLHARRYGLTVRPFPIPDAGKRSAANRWERPAVAVLLFQETVKLAIELLRSPAVNK